MILVVVKNNIEFRTCPHTRGDDPTDYNSLNLKEYLSPHAWG